MKLKLNCTGFFRSCSLCGVSVHNIKYSYRSHSGQWVHLWYFSIRLYKAKSVFIYFSNFVRNIFHSVKYLVIHSSSTVSPLVVILKFLSISELLYVNLESFVSCGRHLCLNLPLCLCCVMYMQFFVPLYQRKNFGNGKRSLGLIPSYKALVKL